jgi:hypothetical protein
MKMEPKSILNRDHKNSVKKNIKARESVKIENKD